MEKILVALSGGVDSSFAAALLKEDNFDVEAAIMCFQGVLQDDIEYARSAAQALGVPFHCFDFAKEYQKIIVDNFIQEYRKGRTPNPCILCNKHIKFDLFVRTAAKMNIEKIATGHYARIEKKDGRYLLQRGKDKNEQSYFLYRLDQQQLAQTILPLGLYTKQQVRKLAKKIHLPTVARKKSQDVCFIPDGDYVSYLKKFLHPTPGPIMDKRGNVIGKHDGIFSYTYGQRRGLGISHKHPYYVIKIDAQNNAVYVGEEKDIYKSRLVATDVHFIPFDTLEKPLEVMAKARYVSPGSSATIEPLAEQKVSVTFKKPQMALTPGQSVVFYQDDIVVGGGIIEEVAN
jgi:tRNA-specific 2-thiouridylase